MRPVPSCAQSIPSTDQLCEYPQLATLAALQTCLRVTGQILAIQHPETGALSDLPAQADIRYIESLAALKGQDITAKGGALDR